MRNKFFLFLSLAAAVIPEKVAPVTTTTIAPEITDRSGVAAIVVVTTAVLVIVLTMSIFGHRMRYSGIRWFTINLCLWGLVHMAYMSAYHDRAPWPEWFESQMWRDKKSSIETIGRSVFPYGVTLLIVERMILTYAPFLEDHWVFNLIFAISFLLGHNIYLISIFSAELGFTDGMCPLDSDVLTNPKCYWFSPVELFGIYMFVLYMFVTTIFFCFTIFSFICCCYSMHHASTTKKRPTTFTDIYFTYWFAQIPAFFYMPSFGFAVMQLVTQKFMIWIIQHGLLEKLMGGGSGTDFNSPMMKYAMTCARFFLEAMPWFVTLFPLAEVVMAVFLFRMYREQLFYILSFGRLFAGKPERWTRSKCNKAFINPNTTVVLIPVQNGNGMMVPPMSLQPDKLVLPDIPPGK